MIVKVIKPINLIIISSNLYEIPEKKINTIKVPYHFKILHSFFFTFLRLQCRKSQEKFNTNHHFLSNVNSLSFIPHQTPTNPSLLARLLLRRTIRKPYPSGGKGLFFPSPFFLLSSSTIV